MRALLIPLLLASTLAACDLITQPLPPVREGGELVVVTRNSPSTFYEDAQGHYAGLEHDLVALFAQELGVRPKFIVTAEFEQILPTLTRKQAHLAAAGLSITAAREKLIRFGPAYQTIQQQVAYNTFAVKPENVAALMGKRIEVVSGSSYVERLQEIRKKYPKLDWKEVAQLESEELLERVAEGQTDCVVADSHLIAIAQNYYPNLGVAFNLGKSEQLAWGFPQDGDDKLYQKAQAFFEKIQKDGTLRRLLDRYYGHVERLNTIDVSTFLENMKTVLPEYRGLFQQAQELTGIDWRLLAALGYQESHWNPLATSPTGVRGLMMLTADTADRLGVSNRLDPKESIPAGARYFLNLKESLPDRIPEPDRSWMALAAYNTGRAHLEDARVLAQPMNLNPDSWSDLKKTLPLLAKAAFHQKAKHGYARGGEAVIFAETTRTYYDILLKFEQPYQQPLPMVLGNGRRLKP